MTAAGRLIRPRDTIARLAGAALGALCLAMSAGAGAAIVEELVHVPVTVMHEGRGEVRRDLPVTVFRDDARARAPFVVLGHGRAASATTNAAMGQVRYTANSRYLVTLGFTVFVPTRIGYGIAGGPDLEHTGDCRAKRYRPGYDAAAQQTRAVVAYARGRPDIDAAMGLVMGQSFGGTTAIAIAADPLPGVRAAVNFAGGGGGRPETHPGQPCAPQELTQLFAAYVEACPAACSPRINDPVWRLQGRRAPRGGRALLRV